MKGKKEMYITEREFNSFTANQILNVIDEYNKNPYIWEGQPQYVNVDREHLKAEYTVKPRNTRRMVDIVEDRDRIRCIIQTPQEQYEDMIASGYHPKGYTAIGVYF